MIENIHQHENQFKFGVYVNQTDVIAEKVFSADSYHSTIRRSVDIRPMVADIIKIIQDVLNSKSNNLTFKYNNIDFLKFYKNHVNIKSKQTDNKLNKPLYNNAIIGKFSFYINVNTIIEREFSIENYNPEARFSIELIEAIDSIIEDLQAKFKNDDSNRMWEDLDLNNKSGLSYQEIRVLSKEDRNKILNKIYKS